MTISRVVAGHDSDIVTCNGSSTVEEAARLLSERRIGALPVLEEGTLAGIFSERDLLHAIAREGQDVLGRRVRDVMTSPAITVSPETRVLEALALMTQRRIRHLPVLENGVFRAFVSIGDLVKYRIESIESEAEQMREYIQTA